MNVQDLREYCLSLKGSDDKLAFKNSNSEYDKDILVFSVAEKWFAFANIEVFDFCNLKCDPEESVDLQDKFEGIVPAYHMNKKHWISVYFNKDVPDKKIKELIEKSYKLVYLSLLKKLKDEIKVRKKG
jgi:predicted DNA-binding protein (MmcQ/YjbR family)